jgi:hypothetical protein
MKKKQLIMNVAFTMNAHDLRKYTYDFAIDDDHGANDECK